MAHFDWYQATIDEFPQVLTEALMEMPGATELVAGRGRQNYHHAMSVVSPDGDILATVLHGGPNGAPNARGTGENAEAFAAIIRQHWPQAHRVTRLDSAEDVRADFPAMHAACREIAARHRIKGHSRIPDAAADGSTYYMGAESSPTRFRCYEKGKQVASSAVNPAEVPQDWVRLETQWRPIREARETAATLSAGEVWGVSNWTQHIARQLLDANPTRFISQTRLKTSYEARYAAMLHQYGGLIGEMHVRLGSWSAVAEQLSIDLGTPSLPK